MKKRINQLLKEKFEYDTEKLILSADRIEGRVRAGENARGKFSVGCKNGMTEGFVYSTNPRVTVLPAMFAGKREIFSYGADTAGLPDGEPVRGEFVICTANGEYRLPYQFETAAETREEETDARPLSPEEFAAMAQKDFGEAYVLFASKQFAKSAAAWGDRSAALYEGLTEPSAGYHSMEQFLVGMGLKEPVRLQLSDRRLYFREPEEDERQELLLTKQGWGFAAIHISSDAPFLEIQRPDVTTEEFVGSVYSCGYVIRKEKLHAGRNFARIAVTAQCRTQECVVEVRRGPELSTGLKRVLEKQEIVQLYHAYMDYRTGRIGEKEWCGISESCLENFRKAGGTSFFLELYHAYIAIAQNDQTKAQILLEALTERKAELAVPQWKGFYLYLTALMSADKEYVDYVGKEIHRLFLANQENWILQWLMLKINGRQYRNDSERLDAIRRQYACGCKSPALYLEAWEILQKEPLLLHGLEEFEIHLLYFLCREQLMDREISGQTAQLALRLQYFHPLLYRVLCSCYEQFPTRNLLTALCSLLIRGHKNTPEYGKWFELGVRHDVRLAGMYEYYAQTASDLQMRELPQAVRMYFSYHNTLDYEKKAAVYANVIKNRDKDPETYETYRPAMELFMEEQLLEGRIDENLALLYETLLTPFVLDEKMIRGLDRALFTCRLTCENPKIRNVLVVHRQLCAPQRVMLSSGNAYLQRYSEDACILLEDREGLRYADGQLFTVKRLLDRANFAEYCRGSKETPPGILLHDCCGQEKEVTQENAARIVKLLGLPFIRESYQRNLEKKLLSWYAVHTEENGIPQFLDQADEETLCGFDKGAYLELLVEEGLCEKAYGIVERRGPEQVEAKTLARLLSWRLSETEEQEDEKLLALCVRCFLAGIYDEAILRYLLRRYEGPLDVMKALWRAGKGFLLEEYALEEKILALVVFQGEGMEETEEIFAAYWKKQGRAKLCRAYVNLMSYRYFVKEEKTGQPIFDYIEREIIGEPGAPRICQLALLRRYAEPGELTPGQEKWRDYLLARFTEMGMRFAFFRKFPGKLLRRFYLYDKFLLEYRTDPANHVTIHYRLNGEKEKSVPMNHVYEGIFVSEFTLFYHDRLEWYICVEEEEKKEPARKSYVSERRSHRGATGQYELLNRLTEALAKKDERRIQELKEQYIGQQYLVDELFTL